MVAIVDEDISRTGFEEREPAQWVRVLVRFFGSIHA